MIPINEIKEGDLFSNPLFLPHVGVVYRVERVSVKDKMVLLQGHSGTTGKPVLGLCWKRNTDRIFSESWRYGTTELEKEALA